MEKKFPGSAGGIPKEKKRVGSGLESVSFALFLVLIF
jgi:hypothetical protein